MTKDDLQKRLDDIAAKHEVQAKRVAAVLATDEVHKRVLEHSAQHFTNLIEQGVDVEHAFALSHDEAERRQRAIVDAINATVADGAVIVSIHCVVENSVTPHVVTVDRNGDSVATCTCGHFRKFAKGELVADPSV